MAMQPPLTALPTAATDYLNAGQAVNQPTEKKNETKTRETLMLFILMPLQKDVNLLCQGKTLVKSPTIQKGKHTHTYEFCLAFCIIIRKSNKAHEFNRIQFIL